MLAGIIAAVFFLAGSALLIAVTTASLGQQTGWLSYLLATFGFCGIYAVVAGLQASVAGKPEVENGGRRMLLLRVPGIVLGGLAVLVLGRTLRETAGGGAQVTAPGRPTPEITANEDFYKVSKNLFDPIVEADGWTLRVGGLVGQELELRYEDILALPWQEQYTTMQCISNRVGGPLIGNAHWRGVPLRAVLDAAGVQPDARFLLMRCADDYTETLPLDFTRREQVMLAYQMNGEPLPHDHGFPLRLLAPGKYGVKHTKWITEMTLIQNEEFGYWQRQGWSQEARMNTSVRIDVPDDYAAIVGGPVLVQGIAFSGDRGISRVEVSTDGGSSWDDATLKPPLSPYTWVLWQYEWRDPDAGGFGSKRVVARAWDGNGELQHDDMTEPYPDGAALFHRIDVAVYEDTGE
jgi:DMSO/TMAO reductase YedYZ molybdopterin-dependent catalytic subunit